MLNVVNIDASDVNAWECLGLCYSNLDNPKASMKAFTRALEINSNSFYSDYKIATTLKSEGQLAEAIVFFESVLEKNPTYVPGLVDMAETYLLLMEKAVQSIDDVRSMMIFEKLLDCISRALYFRNDLALIWNILGLSFQYTKCISLDLLKVKIPQIIIEISSDMISREESTTNILYKETYLKLGSIFIAKAIAINPNNFVLWVNLALNLYKYAQMLNPDDKERSEILDQSAIAIQKALYLNNADYQLWNIFGAIAQAQSKNSLSQHCFIKSLLIKDNPQTLTNLGLLYIPLFSDIDNAFMALTAAQHRYPEYANCWVGLAHLAKSMQLLEYIDLYRHSNTLKITCMATLNLALSVLDIFKDPSIVSTEYYHYCITLANIVPFTIDCLLRISKRIDKKPIVFLLLSLLYERLGYYDAAEQNLHTALDLTKESEQKGFESLATPEKNSKQIILTNLIRLCIRKDKIDEAFKHISECGSDNCSYSMYCNLLMLLFKSGKFQDAEDTLIEMIRSFKKHKDHLFHVLVAIYYKVGNMNSLNSLISSLLKKNEANSKAICQSLFLCADSNKLDDFRTLLRQAFKSVENKQDLYKLILLAGKPNSDDMKFILGRLNTKTDFKQETNEDLLRICCIIFMHHHSKVINVIRDNSSRISLLEDSNLNLVVNLKLELLSDKTNAVKISRLIQKYALY
ncbi:MAG: Tetratricopeptide repeat protein 37, partial [Marteilia pararefringens]